MPQDFEQFPANHLRRGLPENPVIVLGGEAINALAVVRNLGSNGVRSYCVGERIAESVFSRYCQDFFIVPGIERNRRILASFLMRLREQIKDSPVLFPCSDFFCINLSRIEDEVRNQYIFSSNKHIMEIFVNKNKFYQSLLDNGISHPLTYFPTDPKDLGEIGNRIKYPSYLRPAMAQLFSTYFPKKGLVVWSQKDLKKFGEMMLKYDVEFMIQEIIPGSPMNFFGLNGYLDRNHHLKGLFAYRRIREWPIGFGNGSLIESIPVDSVSTLKEITVQYLKAVKYRGLFDAEFKRDPRDGRLKLLEINSRSWWQNHFPTACGINLLMTAYLDAIGEKTECQETYKTGLKWVFFMNDLLSFAYLFRKGQVTFLEWLLSYEKVMDFAYFSRSDPVPWLVMPLLHCRALLKKGGRAMDKNVDDRIPENLFQANR